MWHRVVFEAHFLPIWMSNCFITIYLKTMQNATFTSNQGPIYAEVCFVIDHILNIFPSLFLTSPIPSNTHISNQSSPGPTILLTISLSDSSASLHSSATSLIQAAIISYLNCATGSLLVSLLFVCLTPICHPPKSIMFQKIKLDHVTSMLKTI